MLQIYSTLDPLHQYVMLSRRAATRHWGSIYVNHIQARSGIHGNSRALITFLPTLGERDRTMYTREETDSP